MSICHSRKGARRPAMHHTHRQPAAAHTALVTASSDSVHSAKAQGAKALLYNEKKSTENGKVAAKPSEPAVNHNGTPRHANAALQPFVARHATSRERRNTGTIVGSDLEPDDSDDLCPVCVDVCTCQPGHELTDEVIQVLVPEAADTATKSFVRKRNHRTLADVVDKRGFLPTRGSVRDSEPFLCLTDEMEIDCSIIDQADSSAIGSSFGASLQVVASSPLPFRHPAIGRPHVDEAKYAIDLQSGMVVDSVHPYSFSFSDGEDLLMGECEEEDWDSDDDVYLKYDSVEYEYIVNDLLENEVISEIALMEDPIESLDILLFGSSDYEEEACEMQDVSYELDLVPNQKQLLGDIRASSKVNTPASQPIPIPSVAGSTPFSQNEFDSIDTKGSFSNYTLNPDTGTLSSQLPVGHSGGDSKCISVIPLRSQSTVPFCQKSTMIPVAQVQPEFPSVAGGVVCGSPCTTSSIDDAYDSCYDEDSCWPFSTSPHDGGNSDTGMLSIEDILDSRLYTNSRQACYKNEFLDRYKHIPITAFRRTRRKSVSHSKQSRVNYKRIIMHGDRMLCEQSSSARSEADLLLVPGAMQTHCLA